MFAIIGDLMYYSNTYMILFEALYIHDIFCVAVKGNSAVSGDFNYFLQKANLGSINSRTRGGNRYLSYLRTVHWLATNMGVAVFSFDCFRRKNKF